MHHLGYAPDGGTTLVRMHLDYAGHLSPEKPNAFEFIHQTSVSHWTDQLFPVKESGIVKGVKFRGEAKVYFRCLKRTCIAVAACSATADDRTVSPLNQMG